MPTYKQLHQRWKSEMFFDQARPGTTDTEGLVIGHLEHNPETDDLTLVIDIAINKEDKAFLDLIADLAVKQILNPKL